MNDQWGNLADFYDSSGEEKSYHVAENEDIAGPVIKEALANLPLQARILDFGSGEGHFSRKLAVQGFQIVSLEPSPGLHKRAVQKTHSRVRYILGSSAELEQQQIGNIGAVVSMMVFQFIEDLEQPLRHIAAVMKINAPLVIAVFNPEWAKRSVEMPGFEMFSSFQSKDCLGQGIFGVEAPEQIPVFIRTAEEYRQLLKQAGFAFETESLPPFTEDFQANYARPGPVEVPMFLIQKYVKK